ncbi:MAG: hypothetical protein K1X72_23595 [Pyrinomonadaceae bacterium]|nr:hypothetical protein [Pyrinomonadaceae bacterium]
MNQRFTSYDRSNAASLDYAVNRSYSSGQGRFTQVDPIGMGSGSLDDPQSLNLFGYVQNNPIDFTDPDGLLRIQECTRQWWIDSKGEIHYSSWQCTTIYDDSGGGDGSGGGNGSDQNSQNGIPQDCINTLKAIGVWKNVQKLMKTARLYDVDKIQNKPASQYFHYGQKGQTVGQYFDSQGGDAFAARGGKNKTGIYYRSSNTNLNQDTYLKLHEVTHLAFPKTLPQGKNTDLDEALARKIGLERQHGIGGFQESWSDAVSRYFNNKCNPAELSSEQHRRATQQGGN